MALILRHNKLMNSYELQIGKFYSYIFLKPFHVSFGWERN
jgi:hypothetical protein